MDFGVLDQVSYKIQVFPSPLNSFQGFHSPLDTLRFQEQLASYFLWLTLKPWY